MTHHPFALGFFGLTLLMGLSLSLLPARQAVRSFDSPRAMVAVFSPGSSARDSRDTVRGVGALPRRALMGGTLVSFIAWHPRQVERLERQGAFILALPSRPDFALGCSASAPR